MHNWFLDWDKMDSYEAHVRFEKIHPFQDGNGRIGRAIWLKKALNEGYDYRISFLHKFYYQTLSHSK
jgi:Fic family protein